MSHQPEPISTVDPYEYLQITRNPNGTITRCDVLPTIPATPDPTSDDDVVLSKDLPLNPQNNTSLRVYLPREALDKTPSSTKFPVIVYFHGGGFVVTNASTSIHHHFCLKLAAAISAVVVSVDYRLAPEFRLPAAYDDAVEALHFLKSTSEKWVHDFADVSNCYLMGTSAGGNIAFHVGLRLSSTAVDDDEFDPLTIKGLILHHPFFGGSQRTESEIRLANNATLPMSASDLMWELALPIGADRDHKYCNPTAADEWDRIGRLGWGVCVAACYGDPVIDRVKELVKMMRNKGIKVVDYVVEGDHALELFDLTKAEPLFTVISDFMHKF